MTAGRVRDDRTTVQRARFHDQSAIFIDLNATDVLHVVRKCIELVNTLN